MPHDDKWGDDAATVKKTAAGRREARLAEALRANLRKRKAQARARRKTEAGKPGDETPEQS